MLAKRMSAWRVAAALVGGFALASVIADAAAREVPLITAAKAGDAAGVRAELQKHADVNATEPDGMTAVHWAVQKNALDVVDQLIKAGANVKATTRYGVAPLNLACTNGDVDVVLHLLKGGADANFALPGGETPLMTAARTGKPEVLKALLAYGADVNAKDSARGQTALMWAAAENNADAMKILIEGGANINARTSAAAAAGGRGRGAGAGAAGAGAVGAYGAARGTAAATTPARASVSTPNETPVAAVPPSPSAVGASGTFSGALGIPAPALTPPGTFTALMFAVQNGQVAAVKVLLDAGANVNEQLADGTSTLVLATQNGNWELASYLIDRGVNVNATRQGWTALHQIARIRRTNIGFLPPPVAKGAISSMDLVEKLIAKGAIVNAQMTKDFRDGYRNRLNRVGATPFLLAAKNVDTELMKALLTAGADPFLANADGTTPLMVAAGVDLWNPGEDGGTGPGDEPEALQAVKMLVALGAKVNQTNDRGETALHGAAYRGANTIVQYLVDNGAKLDVRSNQGWTPWTIANGVFYTLFFKEQRQTADLLGKLMADRGISTEGMADDGRTCFDCGRNNRVSRDADGKRVAQPVPGVPTVATPPEKK